MKKRVNAELISIAHRILKLKDASETIKLQQEAKNLYDQLTILRFYEENFELLKNEIPQNILEQKLDPAINSVFDAPISEVLVETEPAPESQVPEATAPEIETNATEKRVVVAELTLDETDLEDEEFENPINETQASNLFDALPEVEKPIKALFNPEDLAAHDYSKMNFVKVEPEIIVEKVTETPVETYVAPPVESPIEVAKPIETPASPNSISQEIKASVEKLQKEERATSLNDVLNKIISFGLNDRIGFEKKLFDGDPNDFNRVVSQLNTFDSFEEAKAFVETFVKPDYNNWEGCEEYETRFMEIVAKKFL